MLERLVELAIIATILGGTYALVSLGLTLIFGVLDVINVAHGEFVTVGGYAAVLAAAALGGWALLSPLLALILGYAIGIAIYRAVVRPISVRGLQRKRSVQYLVATLGLSILLQNGMIAVAGGDYYRVPPQFPGHLNIGFMNLSHQRIMILVVSVLAMVCLLLFLKFHRHGMAIRAVAQNPSSAQAAGIPLDKIFGMTVGIACALACLAGALLAPVVGVYPALGFPLTVKAFAIIILGGFGNVAGALVGSFLLSFAEVFSVLVIPAEWKDVLSFGVIMLVLLFRPSGLFGDAKA